MLPQMNGYHKRYYSATRERKRKYKLQKKLLMGEAYSTHRTSNSNPASPDSNSLYSEHPKELNFELKERKSSKKRKSMLKKRFREGHGSRKGEGES